MKKIILLTTMAILFITVANAQNWVGLTRNEPAPPEITVNSSTNQQVSFTVELSGFFSDSKTEGGVNYQRLSVPACGVAGATGEPEIPVIGKNIAIPVCSQVNYSVQITASQTLPGYRVYPVPDLQPDGSGMLQEVFTLNASAYLQNGFTPAENYLLLETGALREQRFVTLQIQPIQFNPATGALQVVTEMEVTLTFNNPQGALRQNVGIFNAVAANAFINYEDDGMSAKVNDKAYLKEGFSRGSVEWIDLADTTQACTIVADYLIITVPEFFTPNNPNSQLKRLADHRAWYNGYDVAIVNVAQILGLNFYYEGNPNNPDPQHWDDYIKEQKMRTFIKRVYEGANAHHSHNPYGDGRLAYVLLVGDIVGGSAVNGGMPSSYDHDVMSDYQTELGVAPSDYYFSCITKDAGGTYDQWGDLFIGRFSVEDSDQLYNIVHKTINHETLPDEDNAWRTAAGFTTGPNTPDPYYTNYVNWVTGLLDEREFDYYFVYNYPIRQPTLNYWNSGVVFSNYITPSGYTLSNSWGDNLKVDTIALRLQNAHKCPFIVTHIDRTGEFDNAMPCFAEFITCYDSIKGAVGYVGASRSLVAEFNTPVTTELHFQFCFPYFLFKKNQNTPIAGELLLMAKYYVFGYQNGLQKNKRYVHNLFGDPALNILAEPEDTTKCRKSITSLETIPNGESYEVPADCELHFYQNGKLVVEEGGSFIVGDRVHIYGDACETDLVIHVKGGEFILGDNVTFHNINNILLENSGTFPSYDQNKQYDIENAIFDNSPLTHRGAKLYVNNCSFSNRSDIITTPYSADIQNCEFWKSGVKADFVTPIIPYKNFATFVQIENCSFKNTGKYITGYGGQGDTLYSTAAIMLDAIKEFQITNNTIQNANATKDMQLQYPVTPPYGEGIYLNNAGMGKVNNRTVSKNDISQCVTGLYVYNSKAEFKNNHIHNNIYGVRLFNNSATSFEGESYIIDGEQIITDNSSYELYASQYAFPIPFIYNQIIDEDNGGNSNNDPMIYYDAPSFIPDAEIPYAACNYWGINFDPAEDWYPVGMYIVDPVWNKNGICAKGGKLYQDGKDYFANEEYASAKSAFIELIETYPDAPYAIAALHELFALEQFLDNDYAALHDYYAGFTPADSALFNVADFLATRCNVVNRNWQPAIDWYENRIVNPPSYQDSIFAVIDLGDIHLMMEADTLGGAKGKPSCYYTLAHIKPNSKAEYEENKTTLLATLPKIEKPHTSHPIPHTSQKGVLSQNIPNPANGSTMVIYDIIEKGTVEIRLYNSLGQLLQLLPQGTLVEGTYSMNISLTKLPAGMYHYILFVNGEQSDAKKLIVN